MASSSTEAVGQSFGSFSPRGARSKGDQQPDGRVAHNQKLQNIFGVDIGILATWARRARKNRKCGKMGNYATEGGKNNGSFVTALAEDPQLKGRNAFILQVEFPTETSWQ